MNIQHKDMAARREKDFKSLLSLAGEQLNKGDFAAALETCDQLTTAYPESPPALFFLGLARQGAGNLDGAIEALTTAVRNRKSFGLYRISLAELLYEAGRLEEARAHCERAVHLSPLSDRANMLLMKLEGELGNKARAVELAKAAFKRRDGLLGRFKRGKQLREQLTKAHDEGLSGEAAETYANALLMRERGLHDESTDYFKKASKLAPDNPAPAIAAAHNDFQALHTQPAYAYLEERQDQLGKHPSFKLALAEAAVRADVLDVAEEMLGEVGPDSTDPAEYWRVLCYFLAEKGRAAEAVEAGRKSLELAPESIPVKTVLARALSVAGRLDEAESVARDLMATHPDRLAGYDLAASMGRLGVDTAEFARLQAFLADVKLTRRQRASLHFGAGAVLQKAGDADAAFRHFRLGNELVDVTYSPRIYEETLDGIMAAYDRSTFESLAGSGSQDETPILIVGMPRSATTLVEQIIASHPQAFGAGELTALSYPDTELRERAQEADCTLRDVVAELDGGEVSRMAETYLASLHTDASEDVKRITDKMPHNFQRLGLFALMFPKARVIYCKRDAMDNAVGIYTKLFRGIHPYAYDLANIGHHYRQHERIMAYWQEVLPLPIHTVVYEDLVADPATEIRRLIEFCGLQWDERCLNFHETDRAVRTASLSQVRQRIFSSSIGRWKVYEGHLDSLKTALGKS